MAALNGSSPHFVVSDLEASVDYYVDRLGFDRPELWGEPPSFAMPRRDGSIVMLNVVVDGGPRPCGPGLWDAYFWCADADELHDEFVRREATIISPPTDRPLYSMREFEVQDPDGHVLAFGSDLG